MAREAYIEEPPRRVPVVHECDICVIGGSCTGVFAAVRAARLGARVAIVEKQNCFGGMATAGLVNVWHSLRDTEEELPIIGGLTAEVIDRLDTRNAMIRSERARVSFRLNTEELKIELDELAIEHEITPFLHTFYCAPVTDGDRLDAVIVENKGGRGAIRAAQFIDATGDADLALDLDLPAHEPEALQPPTTCAKFYGLPSVDDFDWVEAIREHGEEFGLEPDWGWGGPIPGMPELSFRADTHVFGLDTTSAEELTRAEMEGRRKIRAMLDVMRAYGPEDAAVHLADLAATLGIRETRRICASYRLTGDDVLSGRRFDDAIANGSYPVDTHHSDGAGITFRYLDGTQRTVPERGQPAIMGRWRDPIPEDPTFYQVPFRSLLQERVPNLMLAGRMVDADAAAFSAVRVMVNTNQTGEAAGVAAWMALDGGVPVQQVDAGRLRETLAAGGSVII
ncbi:MAG: FAD-dependent oxidoreductase [Armatimonadota bacterium]